MALRFPNWEGADVFAKHETATAIGDHVKERRVA